MKSISVFCLVGAILHLGCVNKQEGNRQTRQQENELYRSVDSSAAILDHEYEDKPQVKNKTVLNLSDSNFNPLSFRKSYHNKRYKNGTVRRNQLSIIEQGDSYQLMEFSRGIGALIAMYEATDSLEYLNEAIDLCKLIIQKCQEGRHISGNSEYFKDGYKGWVNQNPNKMKNKGPHMSEVPLFESYFFRYLSKLIYLMKQVENEPASFGSDSQFFLDFVEINGWEKWYIRGERKSENCYPYLFRNRTHMTSHWAVVALYLNELTNDSHKKNQYQDFLSRFDNQLKRNLKLTSDSAYVWNITWDEPWPYGTHCNPAAAEAIIQDVSHGNHVITYIIESYELGRGDWTYSDLQKFSNTIKYLIYDANNRRFNGDLGGKFIPKVANGIQMADGVLELARYDENLYSLFRSVYRAQYERYPFSMYEPQYVGEMFNAERHLRQRK